MAESILDSVEKADKGYKDVTKSSIPLKRFLREQNVYLRYLHDEEITGKSIEGLDKILEKKPEINQILQEIINLSEELKNNMDKLDNTRAKKGRNNLSTCDSGIHSIVSQDLEDHRVSIGPHAQDSSAHTHPESCTMRVDSKEAVEGTEC